MNRPTALVLVIIIFIVFFLLAYCGAQITFISSLILATLISVIILNILYPVSAITTEDSDFTLVIYAVFQILSIIVLTIYIVYKSVTDIRTQLPPCYNLT